MKASELRDLNISELESKVVEAKKEYFNLRFQQAVGQLQKTSELKRAKKDIARILTIINEKKNKEEVN
jgi:large subunit ribosomal protein L29